MTTPPPAPPPSSPTPPPTPPGPAAAPAAPRTARPRYTGGGAANPFVLIALVGAVLVMGFTFAPWIGAGGGDVVSSSPVEKTGWEMYQDREQIQSDVDNAFYFDRGFKQDDSPFFTGLSTVIAGAIVAGVALLLLLARNRSSGLDVLLAVLAIAAGILVLVVCLANLVSYVRAGDSNVVGLKWGLIVVWIGAVLSAAIIPAALRPGPARTTSSLAA